MKNSEERKKEFEGEERRKREEREEKKKHKKIQNAVSLFVLDFMI